MNGQMFGAHSGLEITTPFLFPQFPLYLMVSSFQCVTEEWKEIQCFKG